MVGKGICTKSFRTVYFPRETKPMRESRSPGEARQVCVVPEGAAKREKIRKGKRRGLHACDRAKPSLLPKRITRHIKALAPDRCEGFESVSVLPQTDTRPVQFLPQAANIRNQGPVYLERPVRYEPTVSVATKRSSVAMTERGVSFPVIGLFSLGTLAMDISK